MLTFCMLTFCILTHFILTFCILTYFILIFFIPYILNTVYSLYWHFLYYSISTVKINLIGNSVWNFWKKIALQKGEKDFFFYNNFKLKKLLYYTIFPCAHIYSSRCRWFLSKCADNCWWGEISQSSHSSMWNLKYAAYYLTHVAHSLPNPIGPR